MFRLPMAAKRLSSGFSKHGHFDETTSVAGDPFACYGLKRMFRRYSKAFSLSVCARIDAKSAVIGPLHACVLPVQASKADKGLKRAFSLCLQAVLDVPAF
jgi:hypothetical protein